ncbi:DLW-39 family protein [Aestuariimicrobium ganziense]|nr:DLW-39 family protein [Aestuariimicrobium ganziense]
MKKPLLILAVLGAVLAVVGARQKVAEAEREAALWAEATDPVT